ncbi:uncharacterized protein LOC117338869 [Pecten maximus]|uniref:uncharacterized protein LOC117338869 n=1 Tax=Pecten maximus TaxID=6579 RepID=UPI0014583F25|nr:uncharacterized protein LOC117338869 [Pecten maximus]
MEAKCIGFNCKTSLKYKYAVGDKRYSRYVQEWMKPLLEADGIATTDVGEAKMCPKCYTRYLRKRPRSEPMVDDSNTYESKKSNCNPVEEESVSICPTVDDLFFTPSSHRKCCLCLSYTEQTATIPEKARFQLILFHRIWVSKSARSCADHFIGKDLDPNFPITAAGREKLSLYLPDKHEELINDLLRLSYQRGSGKTSFSFNLKNMDDQDCLAWTGWNMEQLQELHSRCAHLISSQCLSTEDCLLLFWVKLKTDISYTQLASIFNLHKCSVSRIFHNVAQSLEATVVPLYLGSEHISRENAINHNTAFTKTFFSDNSEDHIIVDRGFRDVLKDISEVGYGHHIPSFLQPGKSQHDSLEAKH